MLSEFMEQCLGNRLWALLIKETRELLRNRYLLFLILVPPIVQLLILGAALDPQVHNLKLAVVDYASSQRSRDLTAAIDESGIVGKHKQLHTEQEVDRQLSAGKLDLGVIISPQFNHDLDRGKPAHVQILIDGVDAYTAGIAKSYILSIISHLQLHGPSLHSASLIDPRTVMLYNPGQLSSWFFIPGVLGAALTLTSTLVASASVLRERESGTMEQLLITPARSWEILLAKLIPLVAFLLGDVALAVLAARAIFGLPFAGSLLLFALGSMLYVLVGISLGMLLGTFCYTQRQAQLCSLFINIPLILLSGSVVPADSMPPFLQLLSSMDPLSYYVTIARGVILKGVGLDILWPQILVLSIYCLMVLSISIGKFRRQLA